MNNGKRFFAFGVLSAIFFVARPPVSAQPILTVVHPAEGVQLPNIQEAFVYGAVTPGSLLTINGATVTVHPQGGYLTMVPVKSGDVLLSLESKTPKGEKATLERRFSIAPGFAECPLKPFTLLKDTMEPSQDVVLQPGDPLYVSFQGSPQAKAWFSIEDVASHLPVGEKFSGAAYSSMTAHGIYEGEYVIQANDRARQAAITIALKGLHGSLRATAKGRLTIDRGAIPRMGIIKDDVVAVRTSWDGAYDLFLAKGMRVQLTGKVKNERRVRLSSIESGWIKEDAVQELPPGIPPLRAHVANMVVASGADSTLIKVPLTEVLPYRVEQELDPPRLTVTLYGAVDRTDLVRYDTRDTLVRLVRWQQVAPDTCQITVAPKFHTWWGYDIRYEGSTLLLEIRKPWGRRSVSGMVIALDPGHGGPELGAIGPHGTLEKDANLKIARVVRKALESAGAHVVMTRDSDIDVTLHERPQIAWRNRAHLFVSIHCNASGEGDNPLLNNGYSVYWYHPQSFALATAVHAQYASETRLPDRGLFYDDLAVCRMTQMPAILTEQAFIIVPEQERLIFDPDTQKKFASAIVGGIKKFLSQAK